MKAKGHFSTMYLKEICLLAENIYVVLQDNQSKYKLQVFIKQFKSYVHPRRWWPVDPGYRVVRGEGGPKTW